MRQRLGLREMLATAAVVGLSACGGGVGGLDIASAPPPAPTQPPPPSTPTSGPVTIFPSPVVGEYESVGTSAAGSITANLQNPLGPISLSDADLPHIRYTAAGTYEIQLPGQSWQQLQLYGQGTGPTVLTNAMAPGGAEIMLSGSKDAGYQYSELARWWSSSQNEMGAFAFGTPTPPAGVPVTGTATYSGTVAGESDVVASDAFDGPNRASVSGTVNLDFDFAKGTLGGSMTLALGDFAGQTVSLGTFNFKDTVYSPWSVTYGGKFDTTASGNNFFFGNFTGPHAQETIGAWALPFVLDVGGPTILADHMTHQAFGAWIAKAH